MKSINFEFIRNTRPVLADLGGFAEHYAYTDPASALVKLRSYTEAFVDAIYDINELQRPSQDALFELLDYYSFKDSMPKEVIGKLHILRIKGNKAAHGKATEIAENDALWQIREAFELAKWFFIVFAGGTPDTCPEFQPPQKPTIISEGDIKNERKASLQQLARKEEEIAGLLKELHQARSNIAASENTKQELEKILSKAQKAANALEFSEEQTRGRLIDEMLTASGWRIGNTGQDTDDVGQEVEVLHQPTTSGKGAADYVLWDNDHQPLAVIEAKKTSVEPQQGKIQAKYYADGLEKMYGQRPVIFYTNGYEIFIWDDAKKHPPRRVYGYYSKDSLQYCIHQRSQERLTSLAPDRGIVDRLYQFEAIKRISERFDPPERDDRPFRKALMVQATGTGKTRVAIAICELMARARWAKRVLFLCDRRELRKQAHNTFKQFLPDLPRVYVSSKTGEDRDQRIYLATYPAMMKCYQNFDVGFFDLTIADESHRSIYNRYKPLFDYFDAYQIGLTATPVKFIFRNTFKLFDCEIEDPTANYDYWQARDEGFLSPFTVIKHTTRFLREGIHYKELEKDQQEELDDQVQDSESVSYGKEEVSEKVFNKDTDRQILRNLMENGIRNRDGSKLGKTIIFARNHRHAIQLNSLFDEMYPQYGGAFCQVIDNYEPRAEQLIDDFKDINKNLMIAVSVDMLDTGIDVPPIVNLVFAKPVKSYAKFWQMIGRGTRLCQDLFGPGNHKKEFYIFDHWGNFEWFGEDFTEQEPGKTTSLMEQVFTARIELADNALRSQLKNEFDLAIELMLKDIAALDERSIAVRDKYREKHTCQNIDMLNAFSSATRAILVNDIAPLMQWRNLDGAEAAYHFDLLLARTQSALIQSSGQFDDLKDRIINQVHELPVNLTQVAEKISVIEDVKSTKFWKDVSVADLERIRTQLRGIMRYRRRTYSSAPEPLEIDIRDEGVEYQVVKRPKLAGRELIAYRDRVGSVLKELFDRSPVLSKIQQGLPISEQDIQTLDDMVVERDPSIHLDELPIQFPKAGGIAQAIRQIIGIELDLVDSQFIDFVQKYPDLTSHQMRFLSLLKNHISKFGSIELEKLWESPFTSIHSEGIDGVFTDEQQVDDLISVVKSFNYNVNLK